MAKAKRELKPRLLTGEELRRYDARFAELEHQTKIMAEDREGGRLSEAERELLRMGRAIDRANAIRDRQIPAPCERVRPKRKHKKSGPGRPPIVTREAIAQIARQLIAEKGIGAYKFASTLIWATEGSCDEQGIRIPGETVMRKIVSAIYKQAKTTR
jgi:hypothetical protein